MDEAHSGGLISATSKGGSRLRFLLFVAGLVLAGEILTQGVSDQLAPTRPGLAVIWRSDSADALAALASGELGRSDDAAAIVFAQRSLELSPLRTPALSSFALALDRSGHDPQRAERMMSVAGAQGWRDPVVQTWLVQRRLAEGDYADGFARADAVVRVSPQLEPDLFGQLATAVQTACGDRAALAARLATGPQWRGLFLASLAADPRPGSGPAMFRLLAALKIGDHPATDDELALYPERLIAQGRVQDAHQAWRVLSAPLRGRAPASCSWRRGFLRSPIGPGPFDWVLTQGVGWTPSIGPAPDGRPSALAIDYDGDSRPAPLGQRVVLPPGPYRLSGQILAQAPAGSQRMRWVILCESSGQETGDTGPIPAVPGRWTRFETTFTAPRDNCPAQWLVLTANSVDPASDVQVWFDDLAISVAPAR